MNTASTNDKDKEKKFRSYAEFMEHFNKISFHKKTEKKDKYYEIGKNIANNACENAAKKMQQSSFSFD